MILTVIKLSYVNNKAIGTAILVSPIRRGRYNLATQSASFSIPNSKVYSRIFELP